MLSAAQLLQGMSYGHGYTQYQETLKTNDESFLVMYGTLYQDPAIKVKYVIQTEPVMRVILRDTNTDPYEGGNG